MKNIIAISYKSDHTDTVKGCVMDRFGSEFEINAGPEDEVLSKLVKLDMGLDVHDTTPIIASPMARRLKSLTGSRFFFVIYPSYTLVSC